MKNQPLVYIILLNFNGYKDTIECVNSLEKVEYGNFEVIIVDNCSTDDSEKILRDQLPGYKVIQTHNNLGFAGGNNIGIKYALDSGAEYICLLNNDTIVEKDFLNHLVETAESDNNIGITSGIINYFENKNETWFSGGYISNIKGKGIHKINKPQELQTEATFITGCLQLISRKVFKDVGLLPEDYFLYYEDLDFCQSVLNAGYKLVVNSNSYIYHKAGGTAPYTSPLSIYYSNRNRYIFIKKYFGGFNLIFLKISYLLEVMIKLTFYKGEKRKSIWKVLKYHYFKNKVQNELY